MKTTYLGERDPAARFFRQRQVVEDSKSSAGLHETEYDLNGFGARYRMLCLAFPYAPWSIGVRHTADRPLTSRRLRETK